MATISEATAVTVIVSASFWVPNTQTAKSEYIPPPGVPSATCGIGTLQGPSLLAQGVPIVQNISSTLIDPGGFNYPFPCAFTFPMAITQIVADPSTATIGTPPSEVTSYRTRTVIETSASNSTGAKSSDPSAPIFTTAALSGIGIGALVLGILLGLAAAGCLLCCRRRRSKNGRMPHAEERSVMLLSAPPVPPPKDPAMNSPSSQTQSSPRVTPTSAAAVMPPSSSLVGQANVLLPSEGASDDTIAEELIYLGNLIEEHVKNNYHLNSLHVNHSVLRDSLDGLNLDDTMRNHIAVLALAPHTRHVAICHFLALTIFSALDVHYAHGLTLLPPGVAAFMQSLPCDKPEDYQYSTTALDTWRRASAYLLNNNTDKSIPLTPPESPNTQIERFHTAVNRFLSHFVHEDSRALFDQTKNLEGVIYECAVFGYSIFSHPCLWRYTYIHQQHQSTSSDLEKSSLVVLPGLEKLTRLGGEVLGHPDVLVSPSVVSV